MNPQAFVQKWKVASGLTERAACQSHFNDLCDLLGQPKPTDADPSGAWFTFEKGVTTTENRKGFADVWRRGFFGWEYKGKHKDLGAAYQQLLKYREALLNPPLMVVCDLDRFEVHTNFPNTAKAVRRFALDDLPDPDNLATLRALFTDPDRLRPDRTQAQVTADIAERFTRLAAGMRGRGVAPDAAAHFLMKLMFCMFAEDVGLLPEKLFETTVRNSRSDPARLAKLLADLFATMAAGGDFGPVEVAHFNGGLFADADVIPLVRAEIDELLGCAACDWSAVEPSIFGTLFERCLDPTNRTALGAHYTSRADIETLLGPVLRDPLRREWDAVRTRADALWEKAKGKKVGSKPRLDFERCVTDFLYRLAHTTVLDPACGSGNFLYVALHHLLDLEKEVLTYLADKDQRQRIPYVRPTQLRGIERNPYASELAQVVIWIGFHQWMKFNGFVNPTNPVLEAMESIERRDAILDLSDPAHPKEPDWPDAEFIVGNPPFLGDKKMRGELGDSYVDVLRKLYDNRLPGQSDLCCYWFEKSRALIEAGRAKRTGLIATQAIRGGANRQVLGRIKSTGNIFFAIGDRDWILDGANVHVSLVGFDDGSEAARTLDGQSVATINQNLTTNADLGTASRQSCNQGVAFIGVSMHGPFDIDAAVAVAMLEPAGNVNARPNSDVVRVIVNGAQMVRRLEPSWTVFFPPDVDVAVLSATSCI